MDYSGYLLNHTQKLAIDLNDYHEKSKCITQKGDIYAIDPIPVLTETGDGSLNALWDGISADTTENLIGKWCGDLLQIVDKLPLDYNVINCCFAEVLSKMRYCYYTFGVDKENFLLMDTDGNRFKGAKLNIFLRRGPLCYIEVKKTEDRIAFHPVV